MDHMRRNLFRAGAALTAALAAQSFTGLKSNAARAMGQPQEPVQPTGGAICLLRGTMIATRDGERAVEDLRAGELLPTLGHGDQRIEEIICYRAPESPVAIHRNALAPEMPDRDLYVTERHAIYLHGMLCAAGCLLNGHSIIRTRMADADGSGFEYYNLRLTHHAVILANGTPVESYYDEAMEVPCLPRHRYRSPLGEAQGYLRSAFAPVWDFRTPADLMRDQLDIVI